MEIVRGTSYTFEATFVNAADGTPLVPSDPNSIPQVTIRGPAGNIAATGVGTASGNGKYRFHWYVPKSVELNTEDAQWNINWVFVNTFGHTSTHEEDFDIVDKIESMPEERQQTYLTHAGDSERILIRWPTQLHNVSLHVMGAEGESTVFRIPRVATTAAEKDPANPAHLIVEEQYNGEYVYYYDWTSVPHGEYHIYWSFYESPISPKTTVWQVARAYSNTFVHYAVELRTLIDKLQKRIGTPQAYSDADLYSYTMAGLDIINTISPSTNWTISQVPLHLSRGIRIFIIYASAIHALNAQQILEIEINFDFSGQTVSLGYNHDYSGVLGNIETMLQRFADEKSRIVRLANGAAFSGARPKDWRFTNHVWRLDQRIRAIVPPGGGAIWQNIGL